ncbi:hypothetical protein [Rossellomorea sp. BNER]|uniref:hypothetical protein n=1 Tax=Rossellomorea sp. BNER TaxID=2962031 RepID=UPI003AF25555|nr:hypothetical protein [Rossellomorea sp. BNER]
MKLALLPRKDAIWASFFAGFVKVCREIDNVVEVENKVGLVEYKWSEVENKMLKVEIKIKNPRF